MSDDPRELLRQLAAGEDDCLRATMNLTPGTGQAGRFADCALTPRIRGLVRLAALIAVDAPTTSLRWAVELASCAGASEDEIVRVLQIVSEEAGSACAVGAAPRLALAIGYDIELRGWCDP